MQKKKLLFVYYKLFKPGGINRVLTNLVNELIEDYEITILVLMAKHDPFYELDERINLVFIDSFSHWAFAKVNVSIDRYLGFLPKRNNIKNYFYDFGAYQVSKKWVRENVEKYDTIITCQYKLSAGFSMHSKIAKKTIAWEHNPHDAGGVVWGRIRKKNYKNLKFVVATNKAGERFFRHYDARSEVIYNLMNEKLEENKFISIEEKQNYISLIVRLVEEKNVIGFLEIIKNIELPSDWKVKILGDGPLRNQIESYVSKNRLTQKVDLLGEGSIEDVYNLMKESKILTLTSVNEALPTVLIEGMYFSDVLIAYDCKYGPSDIINEKNGYLIPMHDKNQFQEKLEYLIKNPLKLSELNRHSFENSKFWNNEQRLKQWRKLL